MENASKALIIAGAILLAILIIGLGMIVFNNVSQQVGSANLDKEVVETFNSKFQAYEGSAKKGTDVKALIDLVRSSNNVNTTGDVVPQVAVKYGTGTASSESSALGTIKAGIQNGAYYTVTMSGYAAKTGYLSEITIVKN